MHPGLIDSIRADDLFFLGTIALVAAFTSVLVFSACFFWFRRDQRRLQARLLALADQSGDDLAGAPRNGELVAQFRAKQGRQVISVLQSGGKRFVHVDGEITAPERARMVRYLKSEGFMS